jgi:quercetin dioxygenase-like cupin family protein
LAAAKIRLSTDRRIEMLKLGAVASSTILILISTVALAEAPAYELALASRIDDTQLNWGPCPAFIPEGCQIAVLHGAPANSNADVFFRVPADFTIPRHWHTSAERMILVAGELEVAYDGQETITLKPGSYAYGPAKLPHKAYCAKGAACVLFIAFEAPIDAVPTESPAQ